MNAIFSLRNVRKRFGEKEILRDVSFDVMPGEIVAIFGPNGCGKSTLLNIIAGLTDFEGDCGNGFRKDELGYVFQNYRETLLPWRNNKDNLRFPLDVTGNVKDAERSIDAVTKLVDIPLDMKQHPYKMSGGQQQALAFMRALVSRPKLLLLDEPFSAMDYENNLRLRTALQRYHGAVWPTIVMVTHDIEEAIHLASKIIILSKTPTIVAGVLQNPELYPRGTAFLKSEKFSRLKSEALSVFLKGAGL